MQHAQYIIIFTTKLVFFRLFFFFWVKMLTMRVLSQQPFPHFQHFWVLGKLHSIQIQIFSFIWSTKQKLLKMCKVHACIALKIPQNIKYSNKVNGCDFQVDSCHVCPRTHAFIVCYCSFINKIAWAFEKQLAQVHSIKFNFDESILIGLSTIFEFVSIQNANNQGKIRHCMFVHLEPIRFMIWKLPNRLPFKKKNIDGESDRMQAIK